MAFSIKVIFFALLTPDSFLLRLFRSFFAAIFIVFCLRTFYLLDDWDLPDLPERGGFEEGGFIDFTDCS